MHKNCNKRKTRDAYQNDATNLMHDSPFPYQIANMHAHSAYHLQIHAFSITTTTKSPYILIYIIDS